MGADFRGDPAQRDARGARPRAELDLPRPLPRPAVRPLEGAVHLHREPARHDPAAAARPDGRDPALGLHRGGEARDRASGTSCRSSSRRTGSTREAGRRSRTTALRARDPRVHARGRRAQPRAPDRRRSAARRRAQVAEGKARADPYRRRAACASGSARAASRARSRKRTADPGVATGLAVTAVGGDVLFIEATATRATGGCTSPASSAR